MLLAFHVILPGIVVLPEDLSLASKILTFIPKLEGSERCVLTLEFCDE